MTRDRLTVREGLTVHLHYSTYSPDGELIDTTEGQEPFRYVHGQGELLPGLEHALQGAAAGAELQVTVEPADGHGVSESPATQRIPVSLFPDEFYAAPGVMFLAEGPYGDHLPLWIRGVENDEAIVTSEHPLAGATLVFHVHVAGVMETEEPTDAEKRPE